MGRYTALGPVQESIYKYLTADTTLAALAPVLDEVGANQAFPYIEISDISEETDDTTGSSGRIITVTLAIWSQAPGFKESETILDQLIRLLHEVAPSDIHPQPSGWTIWQTLYDRGDPLRLEDGKTRQLVADFKIGVQYTG